MLTFFRKIRQSLLSDSKFSKYLMYALGEIVLVVIGILIALQINNWNEQRKELSIKSINYTNLLDDLKTDSLYIHAKIEDLNVGIESYKRYLNTFQTQGLTLEDVMKNQNNMDFIVSTLRFQNSSIATLENTGEIKLIPSDLRKKIVELKRSQEYLVETNALWNQNYFERIENAGIYGSQPQFQDRIKNQPLLSEKLGIKNNIDKIIWSIEIAMYYKYMNEQNIILELQEMHSDIAKIIDEINTDLKTH